MLKIRHLFIAAVGLLSLTPIVAGASGSLGRMERYQTLDAGWAVNYMPDKNLCILGRPYDDSTSLQVWVHPQMGWTMRLINEKWTGIKADQLYTVTLDMDGGANRWTTSKWVGAWNNAGKPGVIISHLSNDFMWSFMKRSSVQVYNGSTWMTGLYLDGSYAGMLSLLECQKVKGPAAPSDSAPSQEQPGNWS